MSSVICIYGMHIYVYMYICVYMSPIWPCFPPLLVDPSDIGHVDFLEAVHKLSDKPYVIVGLHFDQVSELLSFRCLQNNRRAQHGFFFFLLLRGSKAQHVSFISCLILCV